MCEPSNGLKWWQIRDHQGYPLHPSPEQEALEKEMAEKAHTEPVGGSRE